MVVQRKVVDLTEVGARSDDIGTVLEEIGAKCLNEGIYVCVVGARCDFGVEF